MLAGFLQSLFSSRIFYAQIICCIVLLIEELLEIMSSDAPHSCARDVYQNYIKLLLSVFYVVCQNLSELRHLVRAVLQ